MYINSTAQDAFIIISNSTPALPDIPLHQEESSSNLLIYSVLILILITFGLLMIVADLKNSCVESATPSTPRRAVRHTPLLGVEVVSRNKPFEETVV